VIALFSGSGVGFETPIEEVRGGTPQVPYFDKE